MCIRDRVYTIPVGDMTGAIFYNKEMWKEAGLTEADIPQTWDEPVSYTHLDVYKRQGRTWGSMDFFLRARCMIPVRRFL